MEAKKKTALQEAIDEMQELLQEKESFAYQRSIIIKCINIAKSLLQKEKEDLIEFGSDCQEQVFTMSDEGIIVSCTSKELFKITFES
jgi:hypothetical protein